MYDLAQEGGLITCQMGAGDSQKLELRVNAAAAHALVELGIKQPS